MRSSTRLDSAVFQLTPTRTRFDLVVSANGKTEKIACGLLNPFLAHLKAAQDQVGKGGYSIILEPEPASKAAWFTKSTVERFVCFVRNPVILERVHNLESEILHMGKAISIQCSNDMKVEEHQGKLVQNFEGSRPIVGGSEEKAIVLYKPEAQPPEANGSIAQDANSKVQLLRILETRKTVLEKEQGMAFARAVAAGFEIDHMAPLISFAECFGASRLMDASKRFVELWKRKHETGQWHEVEAAQVTMDASGYSVLEPDSNGKTTTETRTDTKPAMDHQSPQSQFPHHMYAPWPVQSPPVFQAYPMSYCHNYPGSGQYFHPSNPSDDHRLSSGHRTIHRRHSMDGIDGNNELDTWEMDGSKKISQDEMELDEASQNQESRKKSVRSGKKQSGMVVIRNINFITSKSKNSSGSESESDYGSENDEENGDLEANKPEMKHKNSIITSKRKQNHSQDTLNSSEKEDIGHWHAFQNLLLRDVEEDKGSLGQGMFANEKGAQVRRQQNMVGDDPWSHGELSRSEIQNGNVADIDKVSGKVTRMPRASNDELLVSLQDDRLSDGRFMNDHIDSRTGGYKRLTNDDFMIHKRENQSGFTRSSLDSLAVNRYEHANNNMERSSSQNIDGDSYIVPVRSPSQDLVGTHGRKDIDAYLEFPSALQNGQLNRVGIQEHYEPHDLSLMPERGTERGSSGYDPALDYEMHAHAKDNSSPAKKRKAAITDIKQGSKKVEKDRKKLTPDSLDKMKTVGPIRKGKASKLSPLDEAKARAEKLRTYKADLQKMKKEKEDEERRRIEHLKIERQKRIAARGGSSIPAQSAPGSQQTRKQLPIKLSPSSYRGSKFSDSEPGSSSPLQRTIRPVSLGSSDNLKVLKHGRLNYGTHSAGNKISQSVSSLSESKRQSSGGADSKASMAHIRRLSEPKMSSTHHLSALKSRSAEPISKHKSNGPESKKISAIINLDKTKAAALPGLKIRTSKGLDAAQRISIEKDMSKIVNGNKSSLTPETTEAGRNADKSLHHSDGDDNPVIEKNVVTLEFEKPTVPAVHDIKENVGLKPGHLDRCRTGDIIEVATDVASVHASVSPFSLDGVKGQTIELQKPTQLSSFQVTEVNAEKKSMKFPSINVPENPYQPPYARVSSMEACTENSIYGKSSAASRERLTTSVETVKVSSTSLNLKLHNIPEATEKHQVKESSKGFKRLLKFGRKNHSPGSSDHNAESDSGSVHGSEGDDHVTNTSSSSEVHTLKNLISRDETPTANATQQKSSRSFSLLSPFRNKNSKTKQTP